MTEQVLQAAKYLNREARVVCISCDMESFDSGGYCPACQTPRDVSRAIQKRGGQARFVPVLGASGAGKTVYLGMLLDVLSHGTRHLAGLPNNSFSVAVQQQTISALENRRFPAKTVSEVDAWQWVHCEVSLDRKGRQKRDIVTPDMAGDALAVEIEHPGTYTSIRAVVLKAYAIMLLVDSMKVRDAGRDEEFFAIKLASYIHNLRSEAAKNWRRAAHKLAIAIVLTKADACPESMLDPAGFAADNMPGLVKYCRKNFPQHQFFASSVVGSLATLVDSLGCRVQIPLHVEPRGILEPLEWVMKKR